MQRVVGRRLDPVTGKIYHLLYSPPETPEIAARLTQRMDDTEEKVAVKQTYYQSLLLQLIESWLKFANRIDDLREHSPIVGLFIYLKKYLNSTGRCR